MTGPDHIGRARAALVVGVTAMIHSDAVAAVEAMCTANHHLGAASADGTPMAEYADVCALLTQHQVELRALLRLMLAPARGGA